MPARKIFATNVEWQDNRVVELGWVFRTSNCVLGSGCLLAPLCCFSVQDFRSRKFADKYIQAWQPPKTVITVSRDSRRCQIKKRRSLRA